MESVDLLISARWVVPVEPAGVVLEDHALVVHDGRIVDLLPQSAALQRYAPATQVARTRHALIPGLVNAHTHAAMNLFRGVADDLPLQAWLEGHIWPLEGRFVDQAFCRAGVDLAMAEMLRGGISCCNDMYFFPEATAAAAAAAGMRATVGMIVLDFPTAYADSPEAYLARGTALHDEHRGDTLVRTCFAPHAPYTVSDGPLQRIRSLADELDVPIHMHVHETAGEVSQAQAADGCRPLQRLDRLGLLNERLIAVHMTQLEAAEIARYADSGGHVVHCPESNLKLASGFCPVQALSDAGVNVALGTDGAASNNDLDLWGEMRTAALLAKAVAGDASALPAAQALRMVTINGARALGRGDEIGSLERGKWADICAVDLGGLEQQPLYDPVSQLVYAADRHCVSDLWVGGRRLLRERELTTLDLAGLLERSRHYQQLIAGAESHDG